MKQKSVKLNSDLFLFKLEIIKIEAIHFANTAIKVNSYFYNLYTYQENSFLLYVSFQIAWVSFSYL